MRGAPTAFDAQIEASIDAATQSGLASLAAPGRPSDQTHYVIKYTGAQYGGRYPPSPNATTAPGLFVSPHPGFTWGPGVYACPVAYPISGAIYGRCGIVAELLVTNAWRLFDATDAANAQLYVQWAQMQPLFNMLTLTAHANWANHLLRSLFKERFQIDVVVFGPDEFHDRYTDRANDRWLAISEWKGSGRLASGVASTRVFAPKLTVILAEEFALTTSGIRRKAMIGPTAFLAAMAPSPADVIQAYRRGDMLWVGA